jgi:hypothetical protein
MPPISTTTNHLKISEHTKDSLMVNNATNINNNKPPQISEHTKDSLVVNNATNINNNKPPQISEQTKNKPFFSFLKRIYSI